MLKQILKKIVPESIKRKIKKRKSKNVKDFREALPEISESDFKYILLDALGIRKDDVLLIHSSVDLLNISFPSYKIIQILIEIVGENGTILFPTYPKRNSYETLMSGEVFNTKKSPSFTGILSEYARRHSKAIRSLHPTKSVVAIGPLAKELTQNHSESPYPYDKNSPYYKIGEYDGKVVGIGVPTTFLSCVHCVDDILRDRFPVNPYHKVLFKARCIDYNGNERIIDTYAHDMKKMEFDLPNFFDKYVTNDICKDINIDGMKFFRANFNEMFKKMVDLVDDNITIYKKIWYKPEYLLK